MMAVCRRTRQQEQVTVAAGSKQEQAVVTSHSGSEDRAGSCAVQQQAGLMAPCYCTCSGMRYAANWPVPTSPGCCNRPVCNVSYLIDIHYKHVLSTRPLHDSVSVGISTETCTPQHSTSRLIQPTKQGRRQWIGGSQCTQRDGWMGGWDVWIGNNMFVSPCATKSWRCQVVAHVQSSGCVV